MPVTTHLLASRFFLYRNEESKMRLAAVSGILFCAVICIGCVHTEGTAQGTDNSRFLGDQTQDSIARFRYQVAGEIEKVILFDLVGTETIDGSISKRYNLRAEADQNQAIRHTVIITASPTGLLAISEASYLEAVHPMLILSNPVTMTTQNVFKGRIAPSAMWREGTPTGATITHAVQSVVTCGSGEQVATIEIIAVSAKWVYSFSTRAGLLSLRTYKIDDHGGTALSSSLERIS